MATNHECKKQKHEWECSPPVNDSRRRKFAEDNESEADIVNRPDRDTQDANVTSTGDHTTFSRSLSTPVCKMLCKNPTVSVFKRLERISWPKPPCSSTSMMQRSGNTRRYQEVPLLCVAQPASIGGVGHGGGVGVLEWHGRTTGKLHGPPSARCVRRRACIRPLITEPSYQVTYSLFLP